MDPNTGNIYTDEEAQKLGKDPDKLIRLEFEEATSILEDRIAEAERLRRRKEMFRG